MSLNSIKCLLLIGVTCSVLQLTRASAIDTAYVDLSFLKSDLGNKLASLTDKLDFQQVKMMLEKIPNTGETFITSRRAEEMLELSNVEGKRCDQAKISQIEYLIFDYKAFPNLQNYLQKCQEMQKELCK